LRQTISVPHLVKTSSAAWRDWSVCMMVAPDEDARSSIVAAANPFCIYREKPSSAMLTLAGEAQGLHWRPPLQSF
jgi:hypothetical protein